MSLCIVRSKEVPANHNCREHRDDSAPIFPCGLTGAPDEQGLTSLARGTICASGGDIGASAARAVQVGKEDRCGQAQYRSGDIK